VHGTEIHCGYEDQGGVINSLNNYNYVVATGTGLQPSFNFENGVKLSYIMRIKLPSGIKCIEYNRSAYWRISADDNKKQYYVSDKYKEPDDNYAYAAFEEKNAYTITRSTASSAGDFVYIAVPAIDYSMYEEFNDAKQMGNIHSGVIITVMNDDSDHANLSNGFVLGNDLSSKGGQIGMFDISGVTLIKRPLPDEVFTLNMPNSQDKQSGMQALKFKTSSLTTYWAPYNIGANAEYEIGDIFAFGEINGNKSAYTFVSFSHRHNPSGTFYNDVVAAKRFISESSNMYTIAGSRYDAARVKWGKAWRMPHMAELRALWAATNIKYNINDQVNGVAGMSSWFNGNSSVYVFFPKPSSSFQTQGDGEDGTAVGYIWCADKPQRSQGLTWWNNGYSVGVKKNDMYNDLRFEEYSGLPIRAVRSDSVINFQ